MNFFSIREGVLNSGRVCSYTILLIAGLIGSTIALNIVMVILTMSILLMSFDVIKMNKFED